MNKITVKSSGPILKQNDAKIEKAPEPARRTVAKAETDKAKIVLNTEALIKSRADNIQKIFNGAYLVSEKEKDDPKETVYIKDSAYDEIHPEGFERLYTDASEAYEDGAIDKKEEFKKTEFVNDRAYDLVLLDGRRVTASFHKSITSAGHEIAVFKLAKNETIHLSDVFTFKKNEPIQATIKKADAVVFADDDLEALADTEEDLILSDSTANDLDDLIENESDEYLIPPKELSHKNTLKTYEKTIPRDKRTSDLSNKNYQKYNPEKTKFKVYDLLHLQLKSDDLTLARQTERGLVELGSNREIHAQEIHAFKEVTNNVSDEIYSIPGFSATRKDHEAAISTKFRITGFRDGINIYPVTNDSIGQGDNQAGRGYRDSDLAAIAKKAPNFVDFTTEAEDNAKENKNLYSKLWQANTLLIYQKNQEGLELSKEESDIFFNFKDAVNGKGYEKFYADKGSYEEFQAKTKAEIDSSNLAGNKLYYNGSFEDQMEDFQINTNYQMILADGREVFTSYKEENGKKTIRTREGEYIFPNEVLFFKKSRRMKLG